MLGQTVRPLSGSLRLATQTYKKPEPKKPAGDGTSSSEQKSGTKAAPSGADRIRAGVAAAAWSYSAQDSNAKATCLIRTKTTFGKTPDASNQGVSVSAVLFRTTREAKSLLGNPIKETAGAMCLPPYVRMQYKQAIVQGTVPSVYPNAQLVLGYLDKERRAAVLHIKNERANRYMDEQGTFHPLLDVVPLMLRDAKLSDYAKTHYLPNCRLGNVPSYAKNGEKSGMSKSFFVTPPENIKQWGTLAEDLLQDERVANLVAYVINLVDRGMKRENRTIIKLGQPFDLNIDNSPLLRENALVELSGIGCSSSIDLLAISFKEGINEIDDKYTLVSRIRAGGVAVYEQHPAPFSPLAVLLSCDALQLTSCKLLSVEALARSMQLDPEATRLERQAKAGADKKKPDDFTMPLNNMFFVPGIELRDSIERVARNPTDFAQGFTIVSFEPRTYQPGEEGSPWCTKAPAPGATGPKKPSRIRVDLTIVGYQCQRALTERVVSPNNTNADNLENGIFSQAMGDGESDDSNNVKYKVFYEELSRIDGAMGSMGEALMSFGFQDLETGPWKAFAPAIFSVMQGSVSGYVKYFKSCDVALNVPAGFLTPEENDFLTLKTVEDSASGRKYMLVGENELEYALGIAQANARVDVVYNAMTTAWMFDYPAAINKIGIPVSRDTAKIFLKQPKRPQVKVHTPQVLSNGGVYIVNEDSGLPKEDDDTVEYRIIYPNDVPKDNKSELLKFQESISNITPAVSQVILRASYYDNKKPTERATLLKVNNIDADVEELYPMIKKGDGYLFVVPKDYKKNLDNDINMLLNFFAAEGAGSASTAKSIEAAPTNGSVAKADKHGASNAIAKDNSAGKIEEAEDEAVTRSKRKASQLTPATALGDHNGIDNISDTQPFVENDNADSASAPKRAKLDISPEDDGISLL